MGGYEKAHIIGKYYSANNIPTDSVLIKDFEEMLQIYNDLAAQMRNRTFKELTSDLLLNADDLYIEEQKDEEYYQEASREYNVVEEVEEHETKPREKKEPVIASNAKTYYPREAKQAAIALELAGHECEYDSTLRTFINSNTTPIVKIKALNSIASHLYYSEFN